MNPLYFECEVCKTRVKKIQKFSDVFNIKKGQLVCCPQCNDEYGVNVYVAKIFKMYYTFLWGIAPMNFLIIIYILGVYLHIKGLFTLIFMSVIIYYIIEIIITLFLPLHRIKG